MTVAQIVDTLSHIGAMTRAELETFIGLSTPAIMHQVRALRDRPIGHPQRVHIAGWEKTANGRNWAPTFGLSPYLPDVPRPPPTPQSVLNQRYWARNRVQISARRYGERSRFVSLGPWQGLLK